MTTTLNMELPYLADWLVDFEILDKDNVVIDITGAQIQFRVSSIAGVTVMTRTEVDGITITDSVSGQCSLRVTPTQQTSASIAPSTSYQWELRVIVGAITSEHGRGFISVRPSILAA